MEMNRLEPKLPVHAMKSYDIHAPLASHWRKATCEEVDCEGWRSGWITMIDERDLAPRGEETLAHLPPRERTAAHVRRLRQMANADEARAYYIRHLSGRNFTESKDTATGKTVFDFPPGQECFDEHRVRVERPEIFVVRDGDFRGNPTRERRVHDSPDHWVEDFAEHQDQIAIQVDRG